MVAASPDNEGHQVIHDHLLGRLHPNAQVDCTSWSDLSTEVSKAVRDQEQAG